jgi:proteasome lid subunit RPN8/RPN11
MTVRLPRRLAAQIAEHARVEAPLEACGLIPGTGSARDGGQPQRYEPCRNLAASRTRYEVHPEDYLRIHTVLDRAGGDVWGIVHSHPATPAVPSGLDITMAAHPEALYLVISLADAEPELRAWRIVRGVRHEVAIELA